MSFLINTFTQFGSGGGPGPGGSDSEYMLPMTGVVEGDTTTGQYMLPLGGVLDDE